MPWLILDLGGLGEAATELGVENTGVTFQFSTSLLLEVVRDEERHI